MMREIKFRAWDKAYNVYREVSGLLFCDNSWSVFTSHRGLTTPIEVDGWHGGSFITLEQYTSLKDTNGKEIYEGDIVLTNEAEWKAKVVFQFGMFMCVDNEGGYSYECDWEDFKIIGNIHENGELLEVK